MNAHLGRVLKNGSQDYDQVGQLAQAIQEVTLAYVDQGYTGQNSANAALEHGITLEVVEHSFGWVALFRCLARDYERLSETLAGFSV